MEKKILMEILGAVHVLNLLTNRVPQQGFSTELLRGFQQVFQQDSQQGSWVPQLDSPSGFLKLGY